MRTSSAPARPALWAAACAAVLGQPFTGAAWAMYRRARTADKRLLIVRRGHGSTMLAFRDDGPRVLAAVSRFIADQIRR